MTGPEVRAFRIEMGLSYSQFARLLGVARSTVQWWETHGPPYPARILLELLRDDPALVRRVANRAS